MPESTRRAISLAALTILEVPPVEAVTIAAECGYSHLGLRPLAATPNERHFPILSDTILRRELKAAARDCGIAILDTEIVRLKPEMDWAETEAVLEFSQDFGAARLLVADNDPEAERSCHNLARLAEMGSAYGVTPHLEFMPWTRAPNLSSAKERIEGIANCQLLLDAFHLARSGGVVSDIEYAEASIGYLQLCDIAGPIPPMDEILREARSDRLFPGDGDIDLAALINKLPDIAISLEIPADRLRDGGMDAKARAQLAIDKTKALLERAHANA